MTRPYRLPSFDWRALAGIIGLVVLALLGVVR